MRTSLAAAALSILALTASAQDQDQKAEAASRVELAKPQLARGAYFDAIANLKKAAEADPGNLEAAMLLASARRDTGEYAPAQQALAPFDKSAAALALLAEVT